LVTSRAPRRIAALIALGAAIATALFAPTVSASAAGRTTPAATTSIGNAFGDLEPGGAGGGNLSLAQEAANAPVPARAAAVALDGLTARPGTVDPLAAIPSDFSKVMGYQPTLAHLANGDAIAVAPNGGCSVIGGGRPFDLAVPCMAHDLGYDLLRYARRHGDPLGPNARMRVDAWFDQNLLVQCASSYRGAEVTACDAMATTFDAGVGFNSWRQDYGPPFAAAGMSRTVGVIAFGVLLVYFLLRAIVLALVRALRRRRPIATAVIGALPAAALAQPPGVRVTGG
jgi:hypothetical protein